ncbi:hypothetical protein M407DRAFT_244665 [Tulasnella calospora MUT 4182]|uniref:Uncharacterized protein n=1 Tax=Tulasnella calospora MUT 4182 TaxID=1051891 RepID=A0A0C3QF84_9AGAM|nr:hypothetical protein M407DRAFT_244665 [Tulasnella calospora MUT 4182]
MQIKPNAPAFPTPGTRGGMPYYMIRLTAFIRSSLLHELEAYSVHGSLLDSNSMEGFSLGTSPGSVDMVVC